MSASELGEGDLLPEVRGSLPGPISRRLSKELAACEAPGINTLFRGGPSLVWKEARGSNVLDVDGNRFVDFTSGFGVASIGHRHPRVVAAIARQSAALLHGLGDVAAHPTRIALARELVARSPIPDSRAYFAISGADAVEIALKTALLARRKPGILAFEGAYHGLTFGALAVTARSSFRRPFAAQLNPEIHRLPFGVNPTEIEALADGNDLSAVLVEPILGREGVVLPPPGWLRDLREICRRRDLLLIADEILTGAGRTGSFWALEQERVTPDLLVAGKALGGGLPLGVVLGSMEIMQSWPDDVEALHTATFVAHPLACRAALVTLEVLDEESLVTRSQRIARRFEELRSLAASSAVLDVRGRGALWGIELVSKALAERIVRALAERGLLLLAGGPEGRVLQLAPPLVIGRAQLDFGIRSLLEALGAQT